MTPQEEQLLDSLVERVNQTQLTEKDPEAEAYLARTLGQNPDALYILAQTVLVQNIALDQAKAQVAGLQQQLQQLQQAQQAKPAHATSFLGGLLGRRDPAPAQPQTPPEYQTGYQPVNQGYAPAPPVYTQAPPAYAQPQYVPVQTGQPSFLRGAMQTAAGVAAGALAFEGVESLLHGGLGHGGGYGWGAPTMGMGGFGSPAVFESAGHERPVEETVVNNYYGDDRGGAAEHHAAEHGDAGHDVGHDAVHDAGDRDSRDSSSHGDDSGSAHLSNADYRTQGDDRDQDDSADYAGGDGGNELDDQSSYDDGGNYDDSGSDDGGYDDSSSYDDGSSF